MSGDSSEEKTLPPSQKKLRDARKKGQIAKSKDLVAGLGLAAASLYLMARGGALTDRWREAMVQVFTVQNEPFSVAVPQVAAGLADLAIAMVVPMLACVLAAVVVGSVIANQGVVLSFDPLKPKLDSLNPIAGFKRLFGVKGVVELAKSLVKALLLGGSLFVVLRGTWRTLVLMPTCGLNCFSHVIGTQTKLLLGIGVGAFLAAGVADVLIQRWLFLRDMKMSLSEQKREFKEQEGDPHVRGAHRRHRQEAAGLPRTGLARATVLVVGRGVAAGLRYVASEGGVPIIVCRARGAKAEAMKAEAARRQIPHYADEVLASALALKVQPGHGLPNRYFDRGAKAIYSTMSQ
ncbi:EscU/YscU/HrcU family type III secretion system export apparatus switch protein [Methylobacterium sp. J-076]|uniref:EscU/YscU/HrcU family type III secretion system export apparatus switch protein n=1 Tax=Methylobacterium sp. J-076 TaxID=2836655 RepID=UPI001FB9912D|nr:EscU/YscU/HrcU family type III secretion system export apparatus switch protein [Methylobacterium sp. J-076]MCJ2013134.1 EscU/YscU/HrcU family type III secretion system export apparatus switch protein [Methylobacterium sp. J-076]